MPIIQINVNLPLTSWQKKTVLTSAAQLTADIMEKPLCDVMVMLTQADFFMDGSTDPAVFIDFHCISGLDLDVSHRLCTGFLNIIQETAELDASRVYINFVKVKGEHAWRFTNGEAVCPESAPTHTIKEYHNVRVDHSQPA
jgi:hypothetical protein